MSITTLQQSLIASLRAFSVRSEVATTMTSPNLAALQTCRQSVRARLPTHS
jgi:hypothetical protein